MRPTPHHGPEKYRYIGESIKLETLVQLGACSHRMASESQVMPRRNKIDGSNADGARQI